MLITHLKQRGKVGESLLLNSTHGFVDLPYLTMGLSAPAQSYSEAGFRVRVGWEKHASSSPVALCRWLVLPPLSAVTQLPCWDVDLFASAALCCSSWPAGPLRGFAND